MLKTQRKYLNVLGLRWWNDLPETDSGIFMGCTEKQDLESQWMTIEA